MARVAYNFYLTVYPISSVVVTCQTWVALYWAMYEENFRQRRIFRYEGTANAFFYGSGFLCIAVPLTVFAYNYIVHDRDHTNVVRILARHIWPFTEIYFVLSLSLQVRILSLHWVAQSQIVALGHVIEKLTNGGRYEEIGSGSAN